MNSARVRTSLVLLLLVSMVFFPSAQQAFAVSNPVTGIEDVTSNDSASDVTIQNGGILTIKTGATLSLTGLLTVESGGQLIIEDGATIEFIGTNPTSGIVNLAGGVIDQFGAIVFVNTFAQGYVNSGSWTLFCNATTTGAPPLLGIPPVEICVNIPPVAGDDVDTVAEGGVTTTNIVSNDSDADDGLDLLSIVILSGPTNGALVDNGDGTIQYTHDGSETLSDIYTYTINDNTPETSNVATVDITVIAGNDPPVATIISPLDNDTFLIGESVNFVGTASDSEDGDISSSLDWFSDKDGSLGSGASLTLSNLSEGVHIITAQIVDSVGLVDTDSITITIQADIENELFCDDLTIAELEEKATKGKFNLIDNRGGPSATLVGTDRADLILAGNLGDVIEARGGNDCVIGGVGNDEIEGNDGNDEIFGLGGDDRIRGNDGNDYLKGGSGDDDIQGQAGDDKLKGGKGIDLLNGGDDIDTCQVDKDDTLLNCEIKKPQHGKNDKDDKHDD